MNVKATSCAKQKKYICKLISFLNPVHTEIFTAYLSFNSSCCKFSTFSLMIAKYLQFLLMSELFGQQI